MKLSVAIWTYNQEAYIRQCLDSVLMQITDFDFEIVVGDDSSSDKTPEILREYASKFPGKFILLLNEKNQGVFLNSRNVISSCKGEYIAICEGDDYWTDKHKLCQQVNFLDSHLDYGFVGCYNKLLYPDGTLKDDPYAYFPEPKQEGDWELHGEVFEYAKHGPVTRTVSLCFRNALIKPYLHLDEVCVDMVIQPILAHDSLFAKNTKSMCVYRTLCGVSNPRNIEKALYYNSLCVKSKLLLNHLYPQECNFNEEELADSETYLLLKDAIKHKRVKEAFRLKKMLRSRTYKQKSYSKYLLGPITCILLSYKL